MNAQLESALEKLRADRRGGRPVRVQLPDGGRIHGELVEVREREVSLLPRDAPAPRAIPLEDVRVLWIADVRTGRYQLFMGAAGLVGVAVAVGANRLTGGSEWVAAALGIAAVLVVLLAGWTAPPVRRWLVAWLRVYDESSPRAGG